MGCQSSSNQMIVPHQVSSNPGLETPEILEKEFESLVKNRQFAQAQKIADQFYKDEKYLLAIKAYQKIIEGGYTVDFDIEGLGNSDHAISRYQWWTYAWYSRQRQEGRFRGNVFDALSLCYYQISNNQDQIVDKGIIWYQDTIANRQGYELYFGYANVLYSKSRYEQALKYYNKLKILKPNLINSYVSIAMLHEYRRIEKKKSVQMAKIILQKDSNNMYAHFIIARNNTNVDQKISQLKIVSQRFPEYVRATNDIGIAYGSIKKDYKQAIVWYMKCLQQVPVYASSCNNIGVNKQLLEQYQEALPYYLHACELNPKYKTAHVNAIDIFDKLKFNDEQIFQEMKKYSKLNEYYFYYYLGLAYYDKKRPNDSIKWYKLAQKIKENDYELYNSFGISYDQILDDTNAIFYYQKAIKLNPKYHISYFNLAILYKRNNSIDKAIEWYQKAIEVNPRYSYPYNNLGNIYKDKQQYTMALEYYKKAYQSNATYTLAIVNMGFCYLQLEMFNQAFDAFEKAKEILPTDNNNLSQANKAFLQSNIERFDKQGDKWRKTGSIGEQQKKILGELIRMFQTNFNKAYSSVATQKKSDAIVLRQQVLKIVQTIYEDKFELQKINEIVKIVKVLFHDNEDFFHIIPQLFIQYFVNQFSNKKPIIKTEEQLYGFIRNISLQESKLNVEEPNIQYNINLKTKFFNSQNSSKVNLFKNHAFFNNYEALYSEIAKINKLAQASNSQFKDLVNNIATRVKYHSSLTGLKLPKKPQQQFKVILRILQKMFKKQIDKARINKLILKIQKNLRQKKGELDSISIVREIMSVWTNQISQILQERSKNKIETTCTISDLLRGKIMFHTVQDIIEKAVQVCDKLCHLRDYKILQLENRLSKRETRDVVFKIQINEAVCELQLALKQDQTKYHFIHAIYEIQRSPLGCIFGSYLYMSKGFNYPILSNCKDIYERLNMSDQEMAKYTATAAKYIVDTLQEKKKIQEIAVKAIANII